MVIREYGPLKVKTEFTLDFREGEQPWRVIMKGEKPYLMAMRYGTEDKAIKPRKFRLLLSGEEFNDPKRGAKWIDSFSFEQGACILHLIEILEGEEYAGTEE